MPKPIYHWLAPLAGFDTQTFGSMVSERNGQDNQTAITENHNNGNFNFSALGKGDVNPFQVDARKDL